MHTVKDQIFLTELDKKVEITILQRRVESIESKIKSYFSLKAFGVIALIGGLIGGILSYSRNQAIFYYDKSNKFTEYTDKNDIQRDLLSYHSLTRDNNFLEYRIVLREDTIGILERYSKKHLDSISTVLDKKLVEIDSELQSENIYQSFLWAGICGVIFCIVYLVIILLLIFIWKSEVNKLKLKMNDIGAKELKQNLNTDNTKDFFTQLVEINFKYLDEYYLQTQQQADKSFWISAIASIVGFLLIITGVIIMYKSAKDVPGYVATSSGIISEFISAVFFYLYNRTILKMSEYHQKLVITQNISLALKTSDSLQESKSKVLETIIDRLTTDINKYLTNNSN